MKVLLVHNFYGSSAPSGENQVYEAERALLHAHGHEVLEFTRHSDEIREQGLLGMVKGALSTPWNPFAARALNRVLDDFCPDVMHVHNTFPLISPAVFHAAGGRVAMVITLHNYRLFCAAGIPMRAGNVCTDCLDTRSSQSALRHGCYRNSRAATLPLALSVGLHRRLGTWENHVSAFIALSDFQRELMINTGLPAHKVYVKPNFYPGSPSVVPWEARAPYVVFAGRLSPEKGVIHLLRAWQSWGANAPELRLVGEGDLRPELERLAVNLPVRFLGQVDSEEARRQIAGARLLVLPSICFEGFPMVVREAFAFGTPVAVSNLGPLPSIVRHGVSGVVFESSNPEPLLSEVRQAWDTPGLLEQLGNGARAEFEGQYTEEANYASLMDIYERAMSTSHRLN